MHEKAQYQQLQPEERAIRNRNCTKIPYDLRTELDRLLISPHGAPCCGAGRRYRLPAWRTAQNKLKLDLFEKRFAVYDAARQLLSTTMTSGKVSDEEMFKFIGNTREAKWLLNADVAHYLDKELRHKMLELMTFRAELEGLPVGDERSSNVKAQSEIKKWLLSQYDVLDVKFSPFLSLAH